MIKGAIDCTLMLFNVDAYIKRAIESLLRLNEIKDSSALNALVFICFSLVHCFLIQTGRAGSHCKSIASSELKLNIKWVRDC